MNLAANLVAAEVRRRSVWEAESSASSPRRLRVLRRREQVAFTLIEMLVVLGIIGILAAMTLPSFKNAGKGNVTESAMRQLTDHLALARLKAMTQRSQVYVVFAPDLGYFFGTNAMSPNALAYLSNNVAANNMVGGQLTAYALYSPRMVGEQPGQNTPRYLSEWHDLPAGAFIPAGAFRNPAIFHNAIGAPRTNVGIYLDDNNLAGGSNSLPFIGFDESGRLFGRTANVMLPILEGSVMHPKDTNEMNIVVNTDAVETAAPVPSGSIVAGVEYLVAGGVGSQISYPPVGLITAGQTFTGTVTTTYTVASGAPRVVQLYGVRIDWVTGRGKGVRPELQ